MNNHGLSAEQIDCIKTILAPYAEYITQVGLFGSRANGSYRPQSDIDLVLYGDIDEKTVDHLWTLFAESNLPFRVDLKAYEHITYAPLKQHIDNVMQPLFSQQEILKRS